MTMPAFRKILATTTLCLAAVGLSSCYKNMGALSLAEARSYLNQPDTMSREVNYLGSDADFHYFEHKREIARDVRFRISVTENIYLPHETVPYRSWFPERRDAYSLLKGLNLTVDSDLSCMIEGKPYASPAAVPGELWSKVGTVHFCDKRYDEAKLMEQQLAPYLQKSPHVHYSYLLSGVPAHLVPQCD